MEWGGILLFKVLQRLILTITITGENLTLPELSVYG